MANTSVDICNQALTLLGAGTIASLTEGTARAGACARVYPNLTKAIQAQHPWRFTMQKQQLARLSASPVNEWTYAYQLPSGMLAGPYAVFNSTAAGVKPITRGFEIFGAELLTEEQTIVIDFREAKAETAWPPWFEWLCTLALAAAIAPEVTERAELVQEYNARAWGPPGDNFQGGYFLVATQINAQTNPAIEMQTDDIIAARFS